MSAADDIIKAFDEGYEKGFNEGFTAGQYDAQPKHGSWIRIYSRPGVFKYLGWVCDQCGYRNGNEWAPQWHKYCPGCGAKMDKKEGEE